VTFAKAGWVPGRLARNALWAMAGNVVRIGVQALYFVLVARALGPGHYGEFASAVAFVALFSAFAGLGTGFLLMQNVARDVSAVPHYWGRSLGIVVASGVVLTVLVVAVAPLVVASVVPRSLVFVLAVTELLLAPIHLVCSFIFQARERLAVTTLLQVGLAVFRLTAIVVMFALVPAPTASDLGWFYLAATAAAVLVSTAFVAREFGAPRWTRRGLADDVRQTLHFSSSSVAQYVTANVDKVLLARLASTEATGVYSVAQRVTEVATMPVMALLAAAMPRLFQQGRAGADASFALARRLLPALVAYAAVAGGALYLAAPWLPLLVGQNYGDSAIVLRLLAAMPLLLGLYAVAGDALSGAGRQKLRSAVDIATALLNAALNAVLVPRYSFEGAAAALLLSVGFATVSLWAIGLTLGRRREAPVAP
jgi:O-antigen/teichoic acid export membrane protein